MAATAAALVAATFIGASPVPTTISVRLEGPSPSEASIVAGLAVPSWHNADDVAHTVTFTNGRCSLSLEPNARAICGDAFWRFAGRYPYIVTGVRSPDAMLTVARAPRNLTLRTSRTALRRGSAVTLSGTLTFATAIAPPEFGQPVTLMRRVGEAKRFVRFMTLRPRLGQSGSTYEWRVELRPGRTTSYRARDFVQPRDGIVWRNAQTVAVTVRVR